MRSASARWAVMCAMLAVASIARAQDAGLDAGVVETPPDAAATAVPAAAMDAAVVPLDASAGDAGDAIPDADVPDGSMLDGGAALENDAGTAQVVAVEPGASPEREVEREVDGSDDEPTYVPVPIPTVDPGFVDALFPVLPQAGPWTTFGLVVLLALGLAISALVRRVRDALPDEGLVPRIVHVALAGVRFMVLLVAIGIVSRLVPGSLGPVLSWALLAAAAALGWSARDILPDLLASAVLIFERRVRPGVWITAAGHSGIVEARGLRAVWVRDSLEHRIAIPNRLFLSGAVVSQPGGAFHDVSLRFAVSDVPAARLRRALHDAVLASPWVQPDAGGVVRRDGSDPSIWHVRARLIDVRFAVSFEGELLERAEEMLAAEGAREEEGEGSSQTGARPPGGVRAAGAGGPRNSDDEDWH